MASVLPRLETCAELGHRPCHRGLTYRLIVRPPPKSALETTDDPSLKVLGTQ